MGVIGNRAVWEGEPEGSELVQTTVGQLFADRVKATPDKEALVYNYPEIGLNLRLNFREYQAEVDRVAKSLIALGVKKGDHVAVWAPNLPEWVFLDLALMSIGSVIVTVNTAYKASEIEYILRQGDITTLFMVEEVRGNSYLNSIYSVVPEIKELTDPATQIIKCASLPHLQRVVLIGKEARQGTLPYAQFREMGATVSDEELAARKANVTPDDVATIMYTSGTTGFPKGVMISHFNLINTMTVTGRGRDYSADRYVSPMPLFHVAGANFIIWGLIHGMSYIPLIAFDPIKVLELLQNERGTCSFLVPTMLVAMLNQPRFLAGEFNLSTFERVFTGATPIPVVLMEQVREKMGADCRIVFGLTEATGSGTTTLDADPFELRAATVGKAYPWTDIKIVDPASGEPVGFGEKGELLMRGFGVMKGYYNMPEKTAEAVDAEGWLHTGDLATMDNRGYINIVGRVKDMIIRGGENVYPAEVESFLMRHPKVAEAQIIGVPDALMGEEVAALVKLKAGEDSTESEIRDYCLNNIARHKVPKYVHFVTEYPLTASGKVKKFELRSQLVKTLGLESLASIKTA